MAGKRQKGRLIRVLCSGLTGGAGVREADEARRVGCGEDLAGALPKLIDLHLQRCALVPAHWMAGAPGAAIRQTMEHIVRLHSSLTLLLISAF